MALDVPSGYRALNEGDVASRSRQSGDPMAGKPVDSLSFASAKMTRRILGLADVEDLESIADPDLRASCEKRALKLAHSLMVERSSFTGIEAVSDAARAILRETMT